VKAAPRNQPQQQLEQKYENSKSNKPNSPLAFLACSTPHHTGAGYHRCVTAVPARATPACGLNTVILALEHYPSGSLDLMCNEFDQYGWFLKTIIKGDSDVYIVKNTFPSGAHTGWHTHPGPSLVTVTAGTITAYEADAPNCTPTVYHAGDSFTDLGCGDVHLLRNEGPVCAVTIAVQIIPAGQPRRIDADQPANCPTFTCASPTPCPQ
jgi:quercetin dioxygenase-like cupin family protein